MRALTLVCCAVSVLAFAGCNVGDSGDGGGDVLPPGGVQVELACEATFDVTGTFEPAGAVPGPDDGCVPEGTWTLNVTLEDDGGCPSVNFNDQYVYVISRNEDEELVMEYLGSDGNPEEDMLKPGSSGGTCRANIEHWSEDKREGVFLKPFEDDLAITGTGTYEFYEEVAGDEG